MPRMDVTEMPFAKFYPLLVAKAERKGRTREEVDQVITWLTGYTAGDIARLEQSSVSYGDFFRNAPAMNPDRTLITGKICGVRVEEIEDPLFQILEKSAKSQRIISHKERGTEKRRRIL